MDLPPGQVLLNGADVTAIIRTAEVTAASGAVANSPVVRRRLVELQRIAAEGRDLVTEGRDQGTIVFPDAPCKFFLIADPLERARRRQREMADRGETVALADLLQAQQERDARDAARDLCADGACRGRGRPGQHAPDAGAGPWSAWNTKSDVELVELLLLRSHLLGQHELHDPRLQSGTEGRQHVPATGSALLIANHQSFMDPILVGLSTHRHLFSLGASRCSSTAGCGQ